MQQHFHLRTFWLNKATFKTILTSCCCQEWLATSSSETGEFLCILESGGSSYLWAVTAAPTRRSGHAHWWRVVRREHSSPSGHVMWKPMCEQHGDPMMMMMIRCLVFVLSPRNHSLWVHPIRDFREFKILWSVPAPLSCSPPWCFLLPVPPRQSQSRPEQPLYF